MLERKAAGCLPPGAECQSSGRCLPGLKRKLKVLGSENGAAMTALRTRFFLRFGLTSWSADWSGMREV